MEYTIKNLVFAFIFIAAAAVLAKNLSKLYSYLKIAKPENRFDEIGERIKQALLIAIGQSKILRDKIAGPIHAGIFWGFLIFLFSASEAVLQGFFPSFSWEFLGPAYSIITLLTDLFSVIILIAVIWALTRRLVIKVPRLQGDWHEIKDALIVLSSIFVISLSLIMMNASITVLSPFEAWALRPISNILGKAIPYGVANILFEICWWVHIIAILLFANYLPFSKHLHVYTSILNVFFSSPTPVNKLKPINFEEEGLEKFGVVDIEDFTWKNIFDSYTCTHCGRCTSACPANLTGKVLDPRAVIVQIRERTMDKGPILVRQNEIVKLSKITGQELEFNPSDEVLKLLDKKFIGEYESIEALWQCTTCGACMKECPVMIEHVPAIIDMRRSLVLMEANFPALLQSAFGSLENNASPWAFSQAERADWAINTGVKTAAENPEFDVLFWVGCAGSYDDRAKKISRAFSKLMQIAGINFAILGTEEQCNGDIARRTGNEYLADMLVKANIETLNRYNVKKIVTICPHCFNTLKNEYPDFGGQYEVIHHSQYLKELIESGKLKLKQNGKSLHNISYHDSCYMGRYNNIYNEPRSIIKQIPGMNIIEPHRTKDKGLCCGAGGGQMFMEETAGKRVNIERTEELLASNPDTIVANCPFCMTMLTDGVKAKDKIEEIQVKDLAELLLENVEE